MREATLSRRSDSFWSTALATSGPSSVVVLAMSVRLPTFSTMFGFCVDSGVVTAGKNTGSVMRRCPVAENAPRLGSNSSTG
jgi:hypothetical protein